MATGRALKLKSVNYMEIYYTTAMTSNTNLGFVKLIFNLNDLETKRKIILPYNFCVMWLQLKNKPWLVYSLYLT